MIVRFLLILILLFASPSFALEYAQTNCGDSDPLTWCAATCGRVDVYNALLALVAAGHDDSILYIPPGSCTWTDSLNASGSAYSTTVRFYIQGAGQGGGVKDTTITYNGTRERMIQFAGGAGSGYLHGFRGISNIKLISATTFSDIALYLNSKGHPELNIHNITFSNWRTPIFITGYYGVIHSNIFDIPKSTASYGMYISDTSDQAWGLTDPPYGTRNALFVEDNTFYRYCHAVSGFCSSRIVFRYNTRIDAAKGDSGACGIDTHEPGYQRCWPTDIPAGGYTAGRSTEIYGNTMTAGDVNRHAGIRLRAGSAIITGNTLTDFTIGVSMAVDSGSRGLDCIVADGCITEDYGGSCLNVTGRACCQTVTKQYIWGNTFNNVGRPVNNEGHECMIQNVKYFQRAPAVDPDGFTWTPYTYPHPLVSGGLNPSSLSTSTPPNPPKNLHIVSP